MDSNTQLTHAQLLELKRWNTPSVYNGWEQVTKQRPNEDGFNLESMTLPSRSTNTISCQVNVSYATPLGLMAIIPEARSIADAFPQVNTTNLCCTIAKLTSKASFFKFSNMALPIYVLNLYVS